MTLYGFLAILLRTIILYYVLPFYPSVLLNSCQCSIKQHFVGFLNLFNVDDNQLIIWGGQKHFPGKGFNVLFMVLIGVVLFVVGSLLGWFSRLIWTHKKPLSNPLGTLKNLFHMASSYLHVNLPPYVYQHVFILQTSEKVMELLLKRMQRTMQICNMMLYNTSLQCNQQKQPTISNQKTKLDKEDSALYIW